MKVRLIKYFTIKKCSLAQVADVDGKPIPNQDVVMGVNALTYNKGKFGFFDTDFPPDGKVDKYLPDVITQCFSPTIKVNTNGTEIDQLAPVKPGQTVQVVSFINNENVPKLQIISIQQMQWAF